jgi:hypothetical protein
MGEEVVSKSILTVYFVYKKMEVMLIRTIN